MWMSLKTKCGSNLTTLIFNSTAIRSFNRGQTSQNESNLTMLAKWKSTGNCDYQTNHISEENDSDEENGVLTLFLYVCLYVVSTPMFYFTNN